MWQYQDMTVLAMYDYMIYIINVWQNQDMTVLAMYNYMILSMYDSTRVWKYSSIIMTLLVYANTWMYYE